MARRAQLRTAGVAPEAQGNLGAAGNRRHWDRAVASRESKAVKGWLDWEFIEVEHVRPQVSGNKSVYYLQHFTTRHLPRIPVDQALSLGCGGGNLERALVQLGIASRIDACDASPESIRLARELAEQAGLSNVLHYAVADVTNLELPERRYDFVVAKMALHHFSNLNHVYAQVRQSLKPGGVFMFNEYVGPNRFQWTDRQLDLANRILELLPERFRLSALTGKRLDNIARPAIEEMIAADPTEAVNSSDILPLLSRHFEVLELRRYGGTLLHLVLNDLMANFDVTDDAQASLLRMIFLYEQTLMEFRVLDSDFAYVVAQPRAAVADHG